MRTAAAAAVSGHPVWTDMLLPLLPYQAIH
jgi:hypothetical protein